eukprot:INCI15757.2.p1 GENE.INCI15757.2~~INCI15757.2.p1  ORF type:complete len:124 (+),score=3.65 INCI15757.2:145-516(+)
MGERRQSRLARGRPDIRRQCHYQHRRYQLRFHGRDPFCVARRHMKLPLHGSSTDYPTLQTLAMPNEGMSLNTMTTYRNNDGNGNAPYNAGEPVTSDNNYTFTYTNNGDATNPCSPFGFDTNTF